jgi:hypothetical protein
MLELLFALSRSCEHALRVCAATAFCSHISRSFLPLIRTRSASVRAETTSLHTHPDTVLPTYTNTSCRCSCGHCIFAVTPRHCSLHPCSPTYSNTLCWFSRGDCIFAATFRHRLFHSCSPNSANKLCRCSRWHYVFAALS